MRILITAAAIALAPYAVLASVVPAHADPTCSMVLDPVSGQSTKKYESYTGPRAASAPLGICMESGQEEACAACKAPLADINLAGWACGQNGTQGFYGDTVPPCFVVDASRRTDRPGCDGTMLSNGSIQRKDGRHPEPPPQMFPQSG